MDICKEILHFVGEITLEELRKEQKMTNYWDTNNVLMIGTLEKPFTFDHSVFDDTFYSTYLNVERTSGAIDHIPVTISEERLVNLSDDIYDKKVLIDGYIVTTRNETGKLLVNVRIKGIVPKDIETEDKNEVYLSGNVTNKPLVRITEKGRVLCDVSILVKRAHRKVSFVPAIAWEGSAHAMARLAPNSRVFTYGRLQSRIYTKVFEDGSTKEFEVYELSVGRVTYL